MRLATLLVLALGSADSSRIIVAQKLPAGDLSKIKATLTGKILALKGYPWEPVVAYRVADGHLKPVFFKRTELSVFTLEDVRQRNGFLELHGKQKLYVRTEGTQSVSPTQIISPVVLVIYLRDIPATLADQLEGDLFYTSVQDAVIAVPSWQQACVPHVFSPSSKSLLPVPACKSPPDPSPPSYPKLTKQVDPEIPNSLRSEGPGKWEVTLTCTVNEAGRPEDVHVLKPSYLAGNPDTGKVLSEAAGKDMDSNAASAVKQYRFSPMLVDGKPVPSQLFITVNFEIFAN